jgi:transposase
LVAITRHRAVPQSIVLRIRILLGAADGVPNKVLARQLATSLPTVLLWRRRYEEAGLSGVLENQPRSGRPRIISEDKEAAIVDATMETKPAWHFRSVPELVKAIREYIRENNKHPVRFLGWQNLKPSCRRSSA